MNLADIKQRPVAQQSNIGPRASIIPGRRDTRTPDLEVNASLRTARRGTGSADELMRALGMVHKAGAELADYATAKHADDEQDNIARGFADQAAGVVDPEMEERSLGYRNAVTRGRVVNEFRTGLQKFEDEELRGLIERQDDPDIKVRQTEVAERLEAFYHDFSVDPETGTVKRSMQSPGALRYLAESIQSSRAAVTANARARIEQRFNKEAIGHFAKFSTDQIADTGTFDVVEARTLLPRTVTEEQIAEATMQVVGNGVDYLIGKGRYDEAMRLLAGARGYASIPVDSKTPDAERTGAVPAVAGSGGQVSFDRLVAAVQTQESRNDPNAVSGKGAVGLMQTMPGTLVDPGYGVTPARNNSTEELKRVGVDYLKAMMGRYDGDLVLALSAYNAGPARADAWKARFAGKTVGQQIALIPFKETRDYVRSILSNVGAAEVDAGVSTSSAPVFRLQKPGADPVTLYEQTGALVPINGLASVQFAPEHQARLNTLYDQKSAEIRQQWTRKRDEDQAHNAADLMAGVLGLGKTTTRMDAMAALRSEAISPEHFLTIQRGIEAQEDRRAAEADRVEARHDRIAAKQQADRASTIAGRILSPLLAGKANSGQTVSSLMRALPSLAATPEVAQSVMSTVLSVSNGWEKTVTENAEARNGIAKLQRIGGGAEQRLAASGILPSRMQNAVRELSVASDHAEAEFARRVLNGEKPEAVLQELMADVARAEVSVTNKYAARRR